MSTKDNKFLIDDQYYMLYKNKYYVRVCSIENCFIRVNKYQICRAHMSIDRSNRWRNHEGLIPKYKYIK